MAFSILTKVVSIFYERQLTKLALTQQAYNLWNQLSLSKIDEFVENGTGVLILFSQRTLRQREEHLRAEKGFWLKVASKEVTIVTGGDDTLARHTHTAWLADYVARHEVRVTFHTLAADLYQQHRRRAVKFVNIYQIQVYTCWSMRDYILSYRPILAYFGLTARRPHAVPSRAGLYYPSCTQYSFIRSEKLT